MTIEEQRPAREPFLRAPASVLVLIGIFVVVHVGRVLAPAAIGNLILEEGVLDPVVYSPAALQALHVAPPSWFDLLIPPFTHMFLHVSFMHLAINSAWLLAFGPVVARRFGTLGFYLFFLVCGLAGAATLVAFEWGQDIPGLGASGAISGLMGAAIRMIRIGEPLADQPERPLGRLLARPVLLFSAVWMVVNLVTGLWGLGLAGAGQTIAWQDHLGGYMAGLLLAGPFDRLFGLETRRKGGAPLEP